ncbi:Co2+/Mg2+ efflux protein ApaG [Zoogloea sp.]|jgi:ApaG protein|uniref:Co2+/Mg2+ efflux protein ApaG n=1 Tax=Zoogloea sp. TaxID=49181 RepID=UPI0037D9B8B5
MTTSKEQDAIEVRAVAQYIEEQSSIEANRYVFAYRITIRNTGQAPAQLVSRHWIITDAEGAVQEVEGAGVVGKQPLLRPGEQFEYTSGCTIATPVGTMKGSYRMVAEDGSRFDAPVPEFTLAMPRTLH